ncbi:MAG TPA: hypothetical protein VFG39_05110 [Balneolaceae bacterium]|nr:hypothetical protein [Balneolaceae bacterium]
MENALSFFLSGIVFIQLLTACSVTMPVSETIMFQETEREQPDKSDTGLFPQPNYRKYNRSDSHRQSALSFSIRPVLENELAYAKARFSAYVQEKKQEPDIEDSDFRIANPINRAFAVPIYLIESDGFALSGKVGIPVLGMDMTVKTFRNTFVTLNLSIASGELIVQQRLLNNEKIGMSLGIYVRSQRRWLQVIEGPDESFGLSTIFSLLSPARVYSNTTIGIRPVFYIPVGNAYLHAVIAPGYVTNLEQFTVNVGISLGFEI